MDLQVVFASEWAQTYLFPVMIFLARVTDVSLGTLRMVSIARSMKVRAAVLGFVEVLIWLSVILFVLQNLTDYANYIAYAAGFAAGNYLGLLIEEKLAFGLLGVTVVTNRDARGLIERLREEQFGLTSVDATGARGKVRVIYSIVRGREIEKLRQIIQQYHPNSFIAIQNVRSVSKRIYPDIGIGGNHRFPFRWRKGK